MNILDILTETQLCASKGEARKSVYMGAVSVNGNKVTSDKSEFTDKNGLEVSKGKTVKFTYNDGGKIKALTK